MECLSHVLSRDMRIPTGPGQINTRLVAAKVVEDSGRQSIMERGLTLPCLVCFRGESLSVSISSV